MICNVNILKHIYLNEKRKNNVNCDKQRGEFIMCSNLRRKTPRTVMQVKQKEEAVVRKNNRHEVYANQCYSKFRVLVVNGR